MSFIIQLILVIYLSQASFYKMKHKAQMIEIFSQQINENYCNYIVLVNSNDSLSGEFYGVEIEPSLQETTYYKAKLHELKIN